MGKIDYFKIILEKSTPTYFSGEKIDGFVKIKIAERIKINNVRLTLVGTSRVGW